MKNLLNTGNHKDKYYWIRKGAAMLVIIAMVATCVQTALTNNSSETVEAAPEGEAITSLSAIEELKAEITTSADQTFTILEVVPAVGTGSMGYWVTGEEPLTYYSNGTSVSFIEESGLATVEGTSARETAAATVTKDLTELGLLSEGTTTTDGVTSESVTALTSAEYAEYIIGIDTDIPDEAVRIELVDEDGDVRTEDKELSGTDGVFEYKANSTGDFTVESSNVALQEQGSYTQNIDMFLTGDKATEAIAEGAPAFYYQVSDESFTDIDFNALDSSINSDEYAGRAIYQAITDENGNTTSYDYLGSLGVDGYDLKIVDDETYYWMVDAIKEIDIDSLADINGGTYDGREIYTATTDSDGNITYTSLGILGADDYKLYIVEGTTYYWMVEATINYNTIVTSIPEDDTGYYLGIGDFVQVEANTGYFSANIAYVYVGANNGSYSYNTSLTSTVNPVVRYSSLYVNVGFTNNNWFRQYVLDDDTDTFADEFNIEVVEVLPGNLTVDNIAAADLVVFSAGFSLSLDESSENYSDMYTSENDISEDVSNALIEMIADEAYKDMETPIIVDGNLQGNISNTDNLRKIVNQSAIALATNATNANAYGAAAGGLYYVAQGYSFVTRNIIDEIDDDTDYYSEVSATISYENFLRETTGASDILDGTAAEINIGTSIRHILMVGDQVSATQKEEIWVLELQPANSVDSSGNDADVVTDVKVRTWFSGVTEDTEINIVQMTTSEFIGKIDDITEIYDVIYIGADFGNLNTSGLGSNKIVNYNDNDMDGLFYTNIGDTYTVDSYTFTGLLNSDFATDASGDGILVEDTSDTYYALDSEIDTTYRFSGNDITASKLEELETFVATGLPVIISDSLVKNNEDDYSNVTIRTDRVDKASYMYEFLSEAIDESNVYSASEAVDNSTMANQYLNLSKPEIVFETDDSGDITGIPAEYTGIKDIQESLIENNTVTYTFTIENATDPTPEDTQYSVSLYIDQDADGNHEDSELISELVIKDSYDNTVAEDELKSGVMYIVEKELPSSYQGAIPWKLEISIVGREDFHTSETGYTYIHPEDVITINILQVYETDTGLIFDNDYYAEYIEDLAEVDVYELNITGITIADLNNNNNTLTIEGETNTSPNEDATKNNITNTYASTSDDIYTNCLAAYDMLVLGFGDGYGITNDDGGLNAEAAEAIETFIDTGKAVLFAHDTTSTNNVPAEPDDTTYPVSDSIETESEDVTTTGYTYMKWVRSENQYEEYTSPAWSLGSKRWENSVYNISTGQSTYTTIVILKDEVYNYEEGEWGWWVAPDGATATQTTSYTAIDSAYAAGDTSKELPYWDATLGEDGEWGCYAWINENKGLTWYEPTSQPADNVCYIYENGAWGWYEIWVVKETTETVDAGMEWQQATGYDVPNSTYSNYPVYAKTNDNGTWNWRYYNNNTYSIKTNSKLMYYFTDKQWGYWVAPSGTTVKAASYSGTTSTINSNYSYQLKPYYNGTNWGVYAFRVSTSGSNKGVSYLFYPYTTQPDDIYYIYYNGSWGWYSITKTETTYNYSLPEKIAYEYTTTTTTTATTSDYTVTWATSYYFNTILRDAIGLDRYGITNEDYNTNYMYPYTYDDDGELAQDEALVANGYKYQYANELLNIDIGNTITDADVQTILDAGYSIAYEPTAEDGDLAYAEETQGYAIGDLVGRGDSNVTQNAPVTNSTTFSTRVTEVSQVNQGQITTFPYNVNTSEFDSSSTSSTLTVSETHHQYYQLNMNSEDVVVWYCLGGDYYDAYPNDVTNFYYIYNIGNVTYTGAGHNSAGSSTISVGLEEAKLFINTMIAAYRAGRVAPEISFVDSDGVTIDSMYFTMDESVSSSTSTETDTDTSTGTDTLLVQEGVAGSEAEISFKITDTNLENPKSRTISLSWDDDETETPHIISEITIYDSNGVEVKNGDLSSNTLYTLVIPDDILKLLADSEVNSFDLQIRITTTFSDLDTLSGTSEEITLYKLGLQNLN